MALPRWFASNWTSGSWSKIAAILHVQRGAGRPGKDDRNGPTARRATSLRIRRRRADGPKGHQPEDPPQAGRRVAQRLPYDKELYKARSAIECTINLLKQARRFAIRYEKTLRNYVSVVAIGCALLWLRI
jgi:transposase